MLCLILLSIAILQRSYAFDYELNSESLAPFISEGIKVADSELDEKIEQFKSFLSEYFLSDKQFPEFHDTNVVSYSEAHGGGFYNTSINDKKHVGIFQHKRDLNLAILCNRIDNGINFSLVIGYHRRSLMNTLQNKILHSTVYFNKTITGSIKRYTNEDISEFNIMPLYNTDKKPAFVIKLKSTNDMLHELETKKTFVQAFGEINIAAYQKDKEICCASVKKTGHIFTSLKMKPAHITSQSFIKFE